MTFRRGQMNYQLYFSGDPSSRARIFFIQYFSRWTFLKSSSFPYYSFLCCCRDLFFFDVSNVELLQNVYFIIKFIKVSIFMHLKNYSKIHFGPFFNILVAKFGFYLALLKLQLCTFPMT